MAIVSDLHLEKGSYFAKAGQFLPPQDSEATLARLTTSLGGQDVETLVLLGDSFHDAGGYARMDPSAKRLLDALFVKYHVQWITGNHDKDIAVPGVPSRDEMEVSSLTLRHEAARGEACDISGHYHPKMFIPGKTRRYAKPCFIEDGRRLIMPAFGAYTGGLDISHPAIIEHFPLGCTAHVTGEKTIYSFKFLVKD